MPGFESLPLDKVGPRQVSSMLVCAAARRRKGAAALPHPAAWGAHRAGAKALRGPAAWPVQGAQTGGTDGEVEQESLDRRK